MGSRSLRHRTESTCMPSRDPGKSSIMKPRITSRHTEAVVVTRGVLRGLVWLELLPRCCPPNDRELHVPRWSTTPPRGRGARPSHTALSMDCWRGPVIDDEDALREPPRPRRGATTGARGDPEGRTDWSACKSTRERRRTHRGSRRPTCTSPTGPVRVIATARCPCRSPRRVPAGRCRSAR